MKIKALRTTGYKGELYDEGETFEAEPGEEVDFLVSKGFVELTVPEKKEKKKVKTDGSGNGE